MRTFLFKQFHTPLSYLAALSIIIVLSALVGAYSYVQAQKQIKIEANLLIAGEVRTNTLCIGPVGAQVCRTAWPAELKLTDIAAVGRMMQPASGYVAVCASTCQASGAGSNWHQGGGMNTYNIIEDDARNILNPKLTGTKTCIAGTGYNPDGTCKMNTYSYEYDYSCAPGWVISTSDTISNLIKYSGISSFFGTIIAATCKLPP